MRIWYTKPFRKQHFRVQNRCKLRRSYRDACRDATGRRRRRDSVGTISLIPSNMSGSVEQWVFVDLRAIHTKKRAPLQVGKKYITSAGQRRMYSIRMWNWTDRLDVTADVSWIVKDTIETTTGSSGGVTGVWRIVGLMYSQC